MKKIFLLLSVSCFTLGSCNTKTEKKQGKLKEIIAMRADTVKKSINQVYYDLGKEMLLKCFEFPDKNDFKNKIEEIFSVDLDTNRNEVVGLGIKENSELALINYSYIIPSFYDFLYGESEKDVSIEVYKNIGLDKELCAYNNMIFHNDIKATNFIKSKSPELLIDLVKTYSYTTNKDWLKFAFNKSKLYEPMVLEKFLFSVKCKGTWRAENGDCHPIYTLRKDMLDKMIEYGAELSQLSTVANMISNGNPESYEEDTEELYAYLMAYCYKAGQSGIIEYLYDTNPKMIEVFRKKDFYGIEDLEDFTDNFYKPQDKRFGLSSIGPDPYIAYGVINDPDGYTNLRDGKGTSAKVIKKIKEGEKFGIETNTGEWWIVVTEDGTRGRIHSSRVTVIKE